MTARAADSSGDRKTIAKFENVVRNPRHALMLQCDGVINLTRPLKPDTYKNHDVLI